MSYYRDVYLKSEEWQSIRAEVLAFGHYKCAICKRDSETLDAHHLNYRDLYNSRHRDLRALCRSCHDRVHELFIKYPKLKTLEPRKQWAVVLYHLTERKHFARGDCPPSAYRMAVDRKRKKRFRFKSLKRYRLCRDVLVSMRLVKRKRMRWSDVLSFTVFPRRTSPIEYLRYYIALTGIDPRYRTDRIGPHRLLTWPT